MGHCHHQDIGHWDESPHPRCQTVYAVMQGYNFLFAIHLTELIFRDPDKLSQTLQQPQPSNVEGHHIAILVVEILKGLRNDTSFYTFWEKVVHIRESMGLNEPSLPRKRKTPARFQVGDGDGYIPSSPKDEYRRKYFEALDLAVATIEERFN